MFIYENGLPVGYDHLTNNYSHVIHGCPNPEVCKAVEESMLNWYNSMSGQSRVRMGKRDRMLQPGIEINLKRLENE